MSVLFDIMPSFKEACLGVAYDNGMINRFQAEEDWLEKISPILEEKPLMSMARGELWLRNLSEKEMKILCSGEVGDIEALVGHSESGVFVSDALNEVFENG